MNSNTGGGSAHVLNESQQRHLRVLCEYVDKLLSDIESVLACADSKSAFPRYVSEVSPASRRIIDQYIARIRAQLVSLLDAQGIPSEKPAIPGIRAISAILDSIDISLDELKGRNMRGYGEVSAETEANLDRAAAEIQSLVVLLSEFVVSLSSR